MRVLFTTYPERTHFLLMVPLAWALRTAGHEVRFASQPKFADTITQAGLTAVPVGRNRDLWQILSRDPDWLGQNARGGMPEPYDTGERDPSDVTWDGLKEKYTKAIERWHKASNVPMTAGLVDFARDWQPDLVLWDPLTFAGSVAARACGAAHARLLFGSDMYGVTRELFLRRAAEQPENERHDPMRDWLGAYARKWGGEFTEDMTVGQCTVDLVPESLQHRADLTYMPLRFVPYGGAAAVPGWLWERPARPRVALTLGLSVTGHGGEYHVGVQSIISALADLDIEVVATIAEAEQRKLTDVPDNVRVVSFAPLDALTATCDAVIHHAGFGTLATTALRGLPHLMLPFDNDGPALAAGVRDSGAGLVLDPQTSTGEDVRAALVRLLSESSFHSAARRLQDAFLAMPSPNDLVPELEAFVAGEQDRSARPAVAGRG